MSQVDLEKRGVALRRLAKFQRYLILLVIFVIAATILNISLQVYGIVVQKEIVEILSKLVTFSLVFLVLVVGWSLGMSLIYIGLYAVFMFVPYFNMLAVLSLNVEISNRFRGAGIKVGLFGANESDIEMALDPALCRDCGYDLTANVSGKCPECGRKVPGPESAEQEMT